MEDLLVGFCYRGDDGGAVRGDLGRGCERRGVRRAACGATRREGKGRRGGGRVGVALAAA